VLPRSRRAGCRAATPRTEESTDVTQQAIEWMLALPDDGIFAVAERPDFAYAPPCGSFNRTACSVCGEYVFERYLRLTGRVVDVMTGPPG
jgi:formylmethanofuran dehydrogenase subunit E